MNDDYPEAYNIILGDALIDVIKMIKEKEANRPEILGVKLQEEVGEFSEALLKQLGYLEHKHGIDLPTSEAADIFIVVLSILVTLYSDESLSNIVRDLRDQIVTKKFKYEWVLDERLEQTKQNSVWTTHEKDDGSKVNIALLADKESDDE